MACFSFVNGFLEILNNYGSITDAGFRWFRVPTDPIDTPKALKSLKIRFESSNMMLANMKIFGVAVRAVLAVEVEGRY